MEDNFIMMQNNTHAHTVQYCYTIDFVRRNDIIVLIIQH